MLVAPLDHASHAFVAQRLTKRFVAGIPGCRAEVTVLRGVSLEVANGEVLVIVGGAGSGKSTLLLCAAGLLRPDSGLLRWFGNAVMDPTKTCYVRAADQLRDARRRRRTGARVLLVVDLDLEEIEAHERFDMESWLGEVAREGASVMMCARSAQTLQSLECRAMFLERGVVTGWSHRARGAVISSTRVAEGVTPSVDSHFGHL
jgi:ABC-type ATPase involved in cell division